MVGRVLAGVDSLLFLRSGFGENYEVFVFGIQTGASQTDGLAPIKVIYEFLQSEHALPDSFFDYSNRYELQLVRETSCDETVESLSSQKSVDETGKPLSPTYILRLLNGAPKDVLKPDAMLPCYVLRPGKYKILSQDKGHKQNGVSLKDGAMPRPTTH